MEEDPSSAWLSLRVRRQSSSGAEAELGLQHESFVEKIVKEMINDYYIHITYRSVSRANRWSNDWDNCWMSDTFFFFSLVIHHCILISKNTSGISKYSSDMSNIQM